MLEDSNLTATQADSQNTDFFYPFLNPDKFNMSPDGNSELIDFNLADNVGFDLGEFDDWLMGDVNHLLSESID
jgi:hypothetical protein